MRSALAAAPHYCFRSHECGRETHCTAVAVPYEDVGRQHPRLHTLWRMHARMCVGLLMFRQRFRGFGGSKVFDERGVRLHVRGVDFYLLKIERSRFLSWNEHIILYSNPGSKHRLRGRRHPTAQDFVPCRILGGQGVQVRMNCGSKTRYVLSSKL